MARITVEDCIERITNRFELVLMAGQRARMLGSGAPLMLDRDNDKNTVVALREIAADKLDAESLRETLVNGLQVLKKVDEAGFDEKEIKEAEAELEGSEIDLRELGGIGINFQEEETDLAAENPES